MEYVEHFDEAVLIDKTPSGRKASDIAVDHKQHSIPTLATSKSFKSRRPVNVILRKTSREAKLQIFDDDAMSMFLNKASLNVRATSANELIDSTS